MYTVSRSRHPFLSLCVYPPFSNPSACLSVYLSDMTGSAAHLFPSSAFSSSVCTDANVSLAEPGILQRNVSLIFLCSALQDSMHACMQLNAFVP